MSVKSGEVQSFHVLDNEILAFPPNHRHGHARADGGSNVTASDRRRIAGQVAAQEIGLFCLKRFLIIVVAIFGGFKAGFSLGACDLS